MKPNRIGQIAIPAAIVGIVVMMVVPLPTALLDLLLVTNIAIATLALLASMFTTRVLDFSIFPSYLLIATLFRLALNVSVTRLVLLHGYAGKVIESFGHFVVGGSVVVGLVIFLILIVIQFIVITNGAGRVAEVAARFTLDAMPGKQMAIDADLNAGIIDEEKRQAPPPGDRRGSGLLRRDGRRLEVREGRRDRRDRHRRRSTSSAASPSACCRSTCRSARPSRPTACSPSATGSSRRSPRC